MSANRTIVLIHPRVNRLWSAQPWCDLPLNSADRFLLHTDGVTEPENALGESFGNSKLEQVIRNNQTRSPAKLSNQLLSELRRWRPSFTAQQDDITLIVVDVA